MEAVDVSTSSKQYPVVIHAGIRHSIGERLNNLGLNKISSIMIITDDIVAPLYLDDVKKSLGTFSHVYQYVIASGEQSKSFENYYSILTFALERALDRHSLIIALGGGVVGDLAGFVAASYMRGIPFIQVPTTLLAHDSSVGGKVAINHPLGKNMIGAFHQPEAVFYDTDMLATLPEHEWRSGFAEVMKHGLIWDEKFHQWLQETITKFSDIKGDVAEALLKRSISVKAQIVEQDEKEMGIRAYLNFGHTLGHAIETELGYGKITHGEAVAVGMIFAMKLSEQFYQIQLPVKQTKAWFERLGFNVSIPDGLTPEALLKTMKKDKKVLGGTIRMVLLKEIGKADVEAVEADVIFEQIQSYIKKGESV